MVAGPVDRLMLFFTFAHLPPHLQEVSRHFYDLAHRVAYEGGTAGPETTTCLRKLLEAKDCAVRAALHEKTGG